MAEHHPHAAAIERVGPLLVREHFDLTRAALSYWRIHGVPKTSRKALALLGAMQGLKMPELPAHGIDLSTFRNVGR